MILFFSVTDSELLVSTLNFTSGREIASFVYPGSDLSLTGSNSSYTLRSDTSTAARILVQLSTAHETADVIEFRVDGHGVLNVYLTDRNGDPLLTVSLNRNNETLN